MRPVGSKIKYSNVLTHLYISFIIVLSLLVVCYDMYAKTLKRSVIVKKARIALCCIVLCIAAIFFSNNVVSAHPVFASNLPKAGSPTPVTNSEIASLKPDMACPQPPTTIDHATLSTTDLDKYGLPRYQAGKDKNAWKDRVRAMKHRVCGGTPLQRTSSFASSTHTASPAMSPSCSPSDIGSDNWSGNITVNSSTDGTCTQNNQYTEADAVFYVPCIKSGTAAGLESSWVGLGGDNNSNLVQAGTESDIAYAFGNAQYDYYAWTENVAASNSQNWLFSVKCNDRMQVFVYNGETYIHDWNNGDYNTTTTSPNSSRATAEWVVERTAVCFIGCSPQPLADFQSDTFYGMGTTALSKGYFSPHDLDHDYVTMGGRVRLGPLAYNTSWGPPDYANTITWIHQ